MLLPRIIVLFIATVAASFVHAETLNIAVASNFAAPMKALIKQFEQQSPHTIKPAYSSSGKAYAQILHGAPYGLFFSADQDKPKRLIQSGKAVPSSLSTYAIGSLALWTRKTASEESPYSAEDLKQALIHGHYQTLALANPKLAPYGAATQQVLTSLKLTAKPNMRWVTGENIAQTYQFILSGNAELGFIAQSQLYQKDIAGTHWIVPTELYQPIKQDVVILTPADASEAAHDFLNFVKSEQAQQLIRSYGYQSSTNRLNSDSL